MTDKQDIPQEARERIRKEAEAFSKRVTGLADPFGDREYGYIAGAESEHPKAIAAYRDKLRKKVEFAIAEIDKELQKWPGLSPGYHSRLGRKNACEWFLMLLDQP